jgi:protoheme IX farnesyltransferase
MLPVVRGAQAAARQIVVYSVVVVAVTFTLLAAEPMGAIYIVSAAVLGVAFVWAAVHLLRDTTPQRAIRLFTFSNTYLALLFAAVAVDVLVRAA